jgi:hypothetical protein
MPLVSIPNRWPALVATIPLVLGLHASQAGAAAVVAPTFAPNVTEGQKAVIYAAIQWWSMALPDPGLMANPVQVAFSTAALGMGVLAAEVPLTSTDPANDMPGMGVAGTLFAGRPASATIMISNAPGTFFVDDSPHDESEFIAMATNDPNGFDDSAAFFFNAYAGVAGNAATRTDLLTVLKHELGHALGIDGDFKNFRTPMGAGIFGGDDLGNVYADTMFGGLTLEGDGQPGSANESPANNINELSHLDRGIYPNDLMQPTIGVGQRRLQSPLDISMLATAYGYTADKNPSHASAVPALSAWASAVLALLLIAAAFVWQRPVLFGRSHR